MAEQPSFIQTQQAFTAHIRDPAQQPRPVDVEARRMKIYRDLFYNNVEGFVASAFPILRSLIADEAWHAMVRDFFIRHRCQTPYFLEISQEFLLYLQQVREPQPNDPAFMLELAHYEWVELALTVAEGELLPESVDPNGDLLTGRPLLSPLAWPLSYQYAVHRIGEAYQPEAEDQQPTHLVVYRDRHDDVGFIEVNAVTAQLLVLLREQQGITGSEALQQLAQAIQHPNPQLVIEAGSDILLQMRRQDLILGTLV